MISRTRHLQRSAVFLAALLLLTAATASGQSTAPGPPKLILQITVDQLRGDMPASVYDRLGEGGFRYGDMEWETDFPGYGVVFPHPFGKADSKYFTTLLTLSPAGDDLTLEFTRELIVKEDLGQDKVPDYLSISFSSTDYVGHIFGPASLESEDNLLRLDRTLAELLAFVDQKVGLAQTLVVLSSDHGAAEVPAQLNQFGIDAQYFKPDELDKNRAIEAIKAKYGIAEELISGFNHPYIYLNNAILRERELDADAVSRAIAAELTNFNGVAYAVPSIDLIEGKMPDTRLYRQILRNFNPKRSGDIYLVLEPHWLVNDFDGLTVASTHGSPWRYDTFVPIIFAGNGLAAKTVFREVETVDIALTLSKYLNIKAPSGATDAPLIEVLSQ